MPLLEYDLCCTIDRGAYIKARKKLCARLGTAS